MNRKALPLPELSHEAASLIAQLALTTSMAAEDIEAVRALLHRHQPGRVLAAIEQAAGPQLPTDPDERHAYLTLTSGLRGLDELEHTYLQAA